MDLHVLQNLIFKILILSYPLLISAWLMFYVDLSDYNLLWLRWTWSPATKLCKFKKRRRWPFDSEWKGGRTSKLLGHIIDSHSFLGHKSYLNMNKDRLLYVFTARFSCWRRYMLFVFKCTRTKNVLSENWQHPTLPSIWIYHQNWKLL